MQLWVLFRGFGGGFRFSPFPFFLQQNAFIQSNDQHLFDRQWRPYETFPDGAVDLFADQDALYFFEDLPESKDRYRLYRADEAGIQLLRESVLLPDYPSPVPAADYQTPRSFGWEKGIYFVLDHLREDAKVVCENRLDAYPEGISEDEKRQYRPCYSCFYDLERETLFCIAINNRPVKDVGRNWW